MDIFSLLSYINKVSLLAFLVTTLVVGYQVYVLKKEKTKEQTPTIPDFKEKMNFNEVANFTGLPASLTKKELKKVNYSKLIFLIISLLTVMVVIFVIVLIKQSSSVRNEVAVSPKIIGLPTVTLKPKVILSPTPTPSPIVSLTPTLTTMPTIILSPLPTEIVLAKSPSLTPVISSADVTTTQEITGSKPQTLPETGNIGKGFLIFGVAISTIFFSFWF